VFPTRLYLAVSYPGDLTWDGELIMLKRFFYTLLVITTFLFLAVSVVAQTSDPGFRPDNTLFVPHGAIDADSGDLLLISNSWRNSRFYLRRFNEEGLSDPNFILQRFEACCAIRPALVAVDTEGYIYTLEFAGSLNGYYIYKHSPLGELDLDWGQRNGTVETLTPLSSGSGYAGRDLHNETDEVEEPGGFDAGETTLDWSAGGGRMHFYFTDPIELITRPDGSLLVLDRVQRYVYLVSSDGTSVSQFIGRQQYYPIRPQRLLLDSDGFTYLVDYYDDSDINRENMQGVFKFDTDGSWIFGWGESANGINDPWRPGVDLDTLVLDGAGNIIATGTGFTDANHSDVFVFDRDSGTQVHRDNVQYRMGFDSEFLGILGRPDSGFILLESWGFEILVNYYNTEGVRERQVRITDLYSAE